MRMSPNSEDSYCVSGTGQPPPPELAPLVWKLPEEWVLLRIPHRGGGTGMQRMSDGPRGPGCVTAAARTNIHLLR